MEERQVTEEELLEKIRECGEMLRRISKSFQNLEP
jgi:hypothetical protein